MTKKAPKKKTEQKPASVSPVFVFGLDEGGKARPEAPSFSKA
jgi:hypothetical protein